MIIDPGLVAAGLFLLVFPADRLLSRYVELRSFESFRSLENSPRYRPWWWVPLLWLDPIRAFFGAMCLRKSLVEPARDWTATDKATYSFMVLSLAVAVFCQMYNRRDRESLLAPIGFVGGLLAALAPWAVAGAGIAIAVLGIFAFRNFRAFFLLGLLTVGFLGLLLQPSVSWLIPSLVIFAVPGCVGIFSERSLEVPARNSSPRGGLRSGSP